MSDSEPPETNREPCPDSGYPHPRTNERDVMIVELDQDGRLSDKEEVWLLTLLKKYPCHSVKITVEPRYPCGPPCDTTVE